MDQRHQQYDKYKDDSGHFPHFVANVDFAYYEWLEKLASDECWKGADLIQFMRTMRGAKACRYHYFEIALIKRIDAAFFDKYIKIKESKSSDAPRSECELDKLNSEIQD